MEAKKREEEAREQAVEELAREFYQRQRERICPCCESRALVQGTLSNLKVSLRLEGSSSWFSGHEVQVFACLDCGFVGQFVAWDPAFGKARLAQGIPERSAPGPAQPDGA
jgi:hypothetical protein